MASSAIIGTRVGPYSQGSGLVLLYHLLGEHDGEFGAWAFHKRGNGGFTKVLPGRRQRSAARSASSRPSTTSHAGRARDRRGARDGGEYDAPIVVSALDPRRTFLELVDPRELPTDLVEEIRRFRFQGTSAKVNFALDGSPRSRRSRGRTDQYRGFTNIGPSMEYLERAFDEAQVRLVLEAAVPRLRDPVDGRSRHGAARQGGHVVLRPVRAVPAPRERLGHGAGAARRHRAGDDRVVLPGLRQTSSSSARCARRSTSSERSGCPRATSSPASSSPRRCSSCRPGHRLARTTGRRSGLLPVRLRHAPGRLRHGRSGQARGPADRQGPGDGSGAEEVGDGRRASRSCGSPSVPSGARRRQVERLPFQPSAVDAGGSPGVPDVSCARRLER